MSLIQSDIIESDITQSDIDSTAIEASLFEQIACDLEQQGYVILPCGLPEILSAHLLDALQALPESHFHKARIGRGHEQMRNRFVRNDSIAWLDGANAGQQAWMQWCNRLRLYLNRRLYLGLFSFESHFACYAPGDFYKTHYDAFRGEANRVLSLVTYLNKGWEPDQGGELVIYLNDGQAPLKVVPAFGTLVLFLSEEFAHEVLPANRERFSVTGWFRLNASINNQIDPAR